MPILFSFLIDCTPKTTTGQYCSIPFVYNNVTYYGCTDVDHNQPWCFLTPQDSGQWGNCGEFLTLFRLCRLGTWGGFPTCGHLMVISALKIRPCSKLIFTQKMYSAVFNLFVFDWIHFDMIASIYNRTHREKVNIQIQFKVDRLQIIVVAKKYIYVSQLFISRMPKMRAIPQLVSAPLRRNHPPCDHSR